MHDLPLSEVTGQQLRSTSPDYDCVHGMYMEFSADYSTVSMTLVCALKTIFNSTILLALPRPPMHHDFCAGCAPSVSPPFDRSAILLVLQAGIPWTEACVIPIVPKPSKAYQWRLEVMPQSDESLAMRPSGILRKQRAACVHACVLTHVVCCDLPCSL